MTDPVHAEQLHAKFPSLARPDGALMSLRAAGVPELARASDLDLLNELLARLEGGGLRVIGDELACLAAMLARQLGDRNDVHENRFAPRRYLDLYGTFFVHSTPRPPLEGATIVDLGCGGINPLGLLTVLLALGARRGIGVDLDEVRDIPVAARAIAEVAMQVLVDPTRIAWDTQLSREQILHNLAGIDLAHLSRGEASSLDCGRLCFLRESVYSLSIGDGEVDVVLSNAFLEHIPDVERGLSEIARITKRGGFSVHNIDMTDHRRYVSSRTHPLEFLTDDSDAAIVHESNRLRLSDFVRLFEAAGFEIVGRTVHNEVEVPASMRARMTPRFRGRTQQDLEAGMVVLVARRR